MHLTEGHGKIIRPDRLVNFLGNRRNRPTEKYFIRKYYRENKFVANDVSENHGLFFFGDLKNDCLR